ncbi:cytochrome P450 [Hibiscus syriacus]|uniref:Cytochrome P450 n=1 Tax=Hibiscus syriacus TaxID=106335 RepID=A0A6A2ZB78_HIBSY|nr:cytochrome P450 [Hibiscus syriacus]
MALLCLSPLNRTATTHTLQFLGLPKGAWSQGGGFETAGEGIVIGFIDTGIDPTHPSFADDVSEHSYPVPAHFSGICEVTQEFPSGSCNRKVVGARHFAASAITRGIFNSSQDYASPFDGDGHGTHTASVAAGNHWIPVMVAGHHFGNASAMAPHVVAGIDQAAQDGVDIISLSITPNRRPPGIATFFNPIDMALLSAVRLAFLLCKLLAILGHHLRACLLSVHGSPPLVLPLMTAYSNSIILGNNVTIPGVGLAHFTQILQFFFGEKWSYKEIARFGAVATISGGLKENYSITAPKVMYYSARGPDPEDSLLDDADIMKPNLVAPGNMIWAPWSSLGTDSVEFQGENFAMMSGTSMAAPHIAGLAALIKQKFPHFSPAAIASALSTTASVYDKRGGPIMAQRVYADPDVNQSLATPFDMGSGFVDATSALDPVILNYTGQNCWGYNSTIGSADLNLPSITLNQSKAVERTVTNIAGSETYKFGWSAPYGLSTKVTPTRFFIGMGEKRVLTIIFNATMNHSVASFGKIGLFGDRGHKLGIPLSVIVKLS